jgi:ParB family chromosome partitioning protein
MALGKGLGAILDEVGRAYEKEINLDRNSQKIKQIKEIDLEKITPNPFQPRKRFDEKALEELSESIKRHGLLQPIVVIEKGEGYLLVAGERRLKAHKIAGFETIKAIVADVEIDDIRLRELALIENIQRENLNAIELAYSYDELIRVYKITHDELSIILNKSRSQITNTIRLLSLCKYVQQKLIDGKISQGHAKVLVGFKEKEQIELVDMVISEKLSVRGIESIVKSRKAKRKGIRRKKTSILSYKENISKKLPFKFTLKKDRLEIKFKNIDEIKSFLAMLD